MPPIRWIKKETEYGKLMLQYYDAAANEWIDTKVHKECKHTSLTCNNCNKQIDETKKVFDISTKVFDISTDL